MSGDLKEGLESSDGDPKVLLLLNALLSALFAYTLLYLTDLVGLTTFTWGRVLALMLLLMVITFVIVWD